MDGLPTIDRDALWHLAATYPFPEHAINGGWPDIRLRDGEIVRP